jgi:3-isopropylmalate dehydrogenase
LHNEANLVREAVNWTLTHSFVSKDIDPINNYGTEAIGDLIADYIKRNIQNDATSNAVLNASTVI